MQFGIPNHNYNITINDHSYLLTRLIIRKKRKIRINKINKI